MTPDIDTAAARQRLDAWAQTLTAQARTGLTPAAYQRNRQLQAACAAAQAVLSDPRSFTPGETRWPPSPPSPMPMA